MFVLFAALTALALAHVSPAGATTRLSSQTLSSNTVWTTSGSPYVLDGDVTVANGVTLTINPGVIVKFNGITRTLQVNGTLNASGTSGSPISLTSLQDDSVGGDTGGDGPTTGSRGQYFGIFFGTAGSGTFAYLNMTYGGFGFGQGDASIKLVGSSSATASATFSHVSISQSGKTAIALQQHTDATITQSTLSNNGGQGINMVDAHLALEHTTIQNNTDDGVSMTLSNTLAMGRSSLIANEISSNGNRGVYLNNGGLTASLAPYGTRNNIYSNGGSSLNHNQLQIAQGTSMGDWRNNYWGAVLWTINGPHCGGTSPFAVGYIGYAGTSTSNPKLPLSNDTYAAGPDVCIAGRPNTSDFSYAPFSTVASETIGEELGLDSSLLAFLNDPVNPAIGNFVHHVEMRNAAGERIDPYGNVVTRRSPGNHTPIQWDLP